MLQATRMWTCVAVALGLVACGSSAPSDELISARKEYRLAEQSKASELAPDKLLSAKQQLARAERAHADEARSKRERTHAYVAERLAKIAVAYAGMVAANSDAELANQEYRDELEEAEKRARGKLAATEDDLKNARSDLERRERELAARRKEIADKEKALKNKDQELEKTADQLEKEKAARLEAEKKLAATLKQLEEFSKISQESRGLVITLSGQVLFKSGQSNLMPIAKTRLRSVAKALLEMDKSKQIVIEGHTDSKGSSSRNRDLSERRAESVRTFLISEGLPSNRVSAIGKGEDEPIASNRTAEGRANNRRVEIVVK